MDHRLIANTMQLAALEEDQSERQKLHEGIFIKVLEATPPTGTGFHPYALKLGNHAVMAGLDEQTFIDAVRPYILGPRKVPDSELRDAYRKAANDLQPATSLGADYTPKPRLVEPKAFEPVIDLSKLPAATESDIIALSPTPTPTAPEEMFRAFLPSLFADEDFVFIDGQEAAGVLGKNIKSVKGWLSGPLPTGPLFICNSLTGKLGKTKKGKKSYRGHDCVKTPNYVVVEFDKSTPVVQLAWLRWLVKSGSVAAITHSAGKSYHAMLKIDARNADDYARILALLLPWLNAIGADPAAQTIGNLTRLPGATRPDKGGKLQQLIYLNPVAKADVDGLVGAFKKLCAEVPDAVLLLPGGGQTLNQCAGTLGKLLAETGRFYVRNGSLFEVST